MKRESGYYWVKLTRGHWIVSAWDAETSTWRIDNFWTQDESLHLSVIIENRIKHPDEAQ